MIHANSPHSELNAEKSWHILQVQIGTELLVQEQLKYLITALEATGLLDVFVPQETISGRISSPSILFPGYIVVQCYYSEKLEQRLTSFPDIIKFFRAPMSPEDVQRARSSN